MWFGGTGVACPLHVRYVRCTCRDVSHVALPRDEKTCGFAVDRISVVRERNLKPTRVLNKCPTLLLIFLTSCLYETVKQPLLGERSYSTYAVSLAREKEIVDLCCLISSRSFRALVCLGGHARPV